MPQSNLRTMIIEITNFLLNISKLVSLGNLSMCVNQPFECSFFEYKYMHLKASSTYYLCDLIAIVEQFHERYQKLLI